MTKLTTDTPRKIIENFAKEIKDRAVLVQEPKKIVIDFRQDRVTNHARDIYRIPIELLRYRKDNGRIASDVYSYEKRVRPLNEEEDVDQAIIEQFLKEKDPDQTATLKNSIKHAGQKDPAIITCDGFLINGNRRKMALQLLRRETHDSKFDWMNVVILPGVGDLGGPPTVKEIDEIESIYQMQKDGKSEYTKFDRALTMRRKIEEGISLAQQLVHDPNFISLSEAEFKKKVAEYEQEYLKPLARIDKYLDSLGRDGIYTQIASKVGDREGKWQAFLDYYNYVYRKLESEKERVKLGVDENEVGHVEDIAFKLIRFREFPNAKLHIVMRKLPKCLSNEISKKELFELVNIEDDNEPEESSENGEDSQYEKIDQQWRNKNKQKILTHLNKALNYAEHVEEMETPIELLKQAYNKLHHERMDPSAINFFEASEAMKWSEKIEKKAKDLKNFFYRYSKEKDH